MDESKFAQARRVAEQLNQKTEKLNQVYKDVEDGFRGMKFGVSASVGIFDGAQIGELSWMKVGPDWGLFVSMQGVDDVHISKTSRRIRILAAAALDDLVDHICSEILSQISTVNEAITAVEATLETLK